MKFLSCDLPRDLHSLHSCFPVMEHFAVRMELDIANSFHAAFGGNRLIDYLIGVPIEGLVDGAVGLGDMDGCELLARSSPTMSIGILPFKHVTYRWQKLSHSSCT
ncbi:unnamed protein product [Anisakis simplex]|uniref:Uncharacterized protein n=1 Tax=Anisakis simplex TaxID=6269 RepID=A0A0M3J7T3_ANISI|nr:unnamed protein product [Anisakis simplex]